MSLKSLCAPSLPHGKAALPPSTAGESIPCLKSAPSLHFKVLRRQLGRRLLAGTRFSEHWQRSSMVTESLA
ncbi:hypothetical protein CGMCC3_g18017 [Colletotrichum fructicola]|nr:uncharacterized protein CGMCC3_g18017 [Colletotrichum fructicola]KAE9565802.1 hypothetical protein CGMCC3_g18017 [Colletotrichum fructicola]KAF4880210.1 hypothetical protein CGCFRS4_v016089 [Colletotrichum fructicola]